MEDNNLPPPPTPPKEPDKSAGAKVIDMFSRKRKDSNASPQNPETPGKVIQLTPKEQAEIENLIAQAKEVWMRRASCTFNRSHLPNGCSCNYCVYMNMMSRRVFDLIQSDMVYQMRRGKMVFCTPDFLDILYMAIERVMAFEEEQRKNPPTK